MTAGELARMLMAHPSADVHIFGDEMSSSDIDSVVYYETDNYYAIQLY